MEISLQSMYTLYNVHTVYIYIFYQYLIGYDFVRAMYIVITNKITMNRFQIDFRPKWTDLLAYQTAPIINITDAIIIIQFTISKQRSDWDVKSAYFMLNDKLSSFFFQIKVKWSKAKECRCHLNAFCISSHENKRYSGHRIVISFKMCREIFWKINCFNNSASVLVLRLARWFYGKCENYVVIKQLRLRFRFRFRLFMLVILNWKWVISCKRCSWNSFKLYDMMTASYVISSNHLRIHMGWLLPIN